MIAVPLEVPLRTLAPNRLVWIQRGGLVYPYPARIVRDIATDLYVSDEDWDCSRHAEYVARVTADAYYRGTNRHHLVTLLSSVWRGEGGEADQFAVWHDSVRDDSSWSGAETQAAACAHAARNVLTFSLFKHRYMIDTSSQSL